MRWLMRSMVAALMLVGLSQAAWAISQENREQLEGYFADLGTVHYELYAPLGGAEVGGAVIDEGGQVRLHIARVNERRVESLITETLESADGKPPFTFLLIGAHALVYPTRTWMDSSGVAHRRGDLTIYELLSAEAPGQLLQIKDAIDLSFQAGSARSNENLLWQPSTHFLNANGILPRKYNYCRLSYDPEANDYVLYQHLTTLPDAATVQAANLNNRALLRYRAGDLLGASQLLTQADSIASADQSVIVRNQALINSEIEDLADQGRMFADQPCDEALQYLWQGDFAGVLRAMEPRSQYGLSDLEQATAALALAWEKRWPDVDRVTVELERHNVPFLADYLWELAKIAFSHGFMDVAGTRLLALESIDPRHPGYAVGHSRLLRAMGETEQGEQVLERYLSDPANAGRDLSDPRLELYGLYYKRANLVGCERLAEDALRAPVTNLQAYVQLADYADLSTSLADVPIDASGRIPAPQHPLETFGVN